MRLIPLLDKYQHIETVRPKGSYLHGKLEKEMGYDIFGIMIEDAPSEYVNNETSYLKDFPSGLYNCFCMGIPCTFFYWRTNFGDENGLVIAYDENDRIKLDVLKLYSVKSNVI